MSADSRHALDSRTEWLNSEPLTAAGPRWRLVPASCSRCWDTIQPFPSFSEIQAFALNALQRGIAAASPPVGAT